MRFLRNIRGVGNLAMKLGDYEGRCYTGLIRHLLLCSLAYYFLRMKWLKLSKKRKIDVLSSVATLIYAKSIAANGNSHIAL